VPTLDPVGEYLTRVWRDGVYPLADKLGVIMKLPPVQPRSRLGHEAAKWATTVNRFDDYNEAVFRAFFERGENIGEVEVLVKLAEQLELDAEELRRALTQREFEEHVVADERAAAALGAACGISWATAGAASGAGSCPASMATRSKHPAATRSSSVRA